MPQDHKTSSASSSASCANQHGQRGHSHQQCQQNTQENSHQESTHQESHTAKHSCDTASESRAESSVSCCGTGAKAKAQANASSCSSAKAHAHASASYGNSAEGIVTEYQAENQSHAHTSCCGSSATTTAQTSASCCDSDGQSRDYWFWGAFTLVIASYFAYLVLPSMGQVTSLTHSVFELLNTMAIGLVIGVLMVAVLSYVPREFVIAILGTNSGIKGLFKATIAGLLLDLCSHGILMVGAKLYERGASTGQVMAFLIASPWNSLSLTIILVTLIGFGWTLMFILLSVVIGIVTGWTFDWLVSRGTLPKNPHNVELPANFNFKQALRHEIKQLSFTRKTLANFVKKGLQESRMVIKWLFIGILLASLIRTFVPEDYFSTYFGPTLLGLVVTLFAATVIEVCSEGSTPIAADIFNRAAAPGNGFAFLMTGVSTDYTEIMVLKETTRSWKLALFLPLITLPQIVVVSLILNAV